MSKEVEKIETENATVEVVEKKKFEIPTKVKTVLKVTAIGAASAVAGFILGKSLKGKPTDETDDLTIIDLDEDYETEEE